MIIYNVLYKCKPGKRADFLEAIKREGIGEACRAEEGNLKYDYFLSDSNPDEILLVEKWKDHDALVAHREQPHMALLKTIKAKYVDETSIDRFEAAE